MIPRRVLLLLFVPALLLSTDLRGATLYSDEQILAFYDYELNRKKGAHIMKKSIPRTWPAFLLVVLCTAAAPADDWPVFMHGASRCGHSPEEVRAVHDLLWTYDAGGMILSSPVVADGIVYFGASDGNLHALDAADGSLVWLFETGAWIESAPAVSEGILYTGAMDRFVYALDARSGDELWRFETSSWVQCSPLPVDGLLFVGGMDTRLYALDAFSGALTLSVKTAGYIAAPPSFVNTPEGGRIIAATNGYEVYAFIPDTGELVWQWSCPAGMFIETAPVCAGGGVFLGVSDNGVHGGGSFDNKLTALDAVDGSVIWELELDENDMLMGTPTLADGILVAPAFSGRIYGVAAADGRLEWSIRPADYAHFASAAASAEMAVAHDLNGGLYLLDPSNGRARQVFDAG